MKVWELRSPGLENLILAERAEPAPGPRDVMIKLHAASLNRRDLRIALGKYSMGLIKWPLVLLSDGAGEIVATGAEASQWRLGDRVAANFFTGWVDGPLTPAKAATALGGAIDGVLADAIVVPAQAVVRAPEHMTDVEAATLPCAAVTVWNALFEGVPVRPGETVLVEGTGGVSMFGVQLARLAGARVLATSSSDAKLQRARDAGAEAGVNYRSTPEWHERIIELTGGRGVDHVLEVGGESTLDRALRSLRYGGQLHIIGGLSGSFGAVNVGLMAARNAQVSRVYVGSVSMFEAMNRALSLQRVHPIVDRVFPFADAPAAFRYLESSAHVGKIVIQW